MDPETIRLILIVVGIVLILALYLWERSQDPEDEPDESDDTEDVDGDDLDADAPYGVGIRKREPSLGLTDPPQRASGAAPSDTAAPARPSPQPLLIQLSVTAGPQPFSGPDLLDAAESCGLHPGEMDIFHCSDEFDGEVQVYFSMANLVKPGTFPFQDMEGFATPGVLLFAQLEGHPEDMTVLDEMIATARKLASVLNGELLDDARRPLTIKKEEAMRQSVLDNERRWKQARPW